MVVRVEGDEHYNNCGALSLPCVKNFERFTKKNCIDFPTSENEKLRSLQI